MRKVYTVTQKTGHFILLVAARTNFEVTTFEGSWLILAGVPMRI